MFMSAFRWNASTCSTGLDIMEAVLQILEFAQEEEEEEVLLGRPRVERVFEVRVDALRKYSDSKFIRRFRVSKDTFRWLVDFLAPDLMPLKESNHALNPEQQVLVAMRFYARASFQMDIGDMCGVSQATVCRVVHRVSSAICARRQQFIHFPTTPEERRTIAEGFYEIAQFPGVVGAIDGSHVAIVNPGGERAAHFINRKGWYSINCQGVVDHQLLFTNIVARWYGSAHDSRIFQESQLFRKFQAGEYRGILLGDPAYTCSTFMLTPVRNPTTPEENRYNNAQRRTRGVVERAFGIWKKRFPCVSKGMHLRCSVSIINGSLVMETVYSPLCCTLCQKNTLTQIN
ncbi:putative nuclease HARBI1 [Lineus longissimus]|uniref:putative nuclease HARBI1 n=1 Tax=Lineus longissimus TaxID=88925 RepID=UPI00315DF1FF